MSSWPVTFRLDCHICILTSFSQKSHGCSNFILSILLIVLGHLTKRAATPRYGKTKYVSMISLSWPWPYLTGDQVKASGPLVLIINWQVWSSTSFRTSPRNHGIPGIKPEVPTLWNSAIIYYHFSMNKNSDCPLFFLRLDTINDRIMTWLSLNRTDI